MRGLDRLDVLGEGNGLGVGRLERDVPLVDGR